MVLTAKEMVNKTKKQPPEWEKIFANDTTDKRLISKIYKKLLKLNTQKTNSHVKKWAEDMNRQQRRYTMREENQRRPTNG